MSQNSTTSYTFTPINVDNGDGDDNSTPTSTSRLDKQVGSIKRLQSNATVLIQATSTLDDVLESIERLVYRGKLKDIATLKSVQQTLLIVSNSIEKDRLEFSLG